MFPLIHSASLLCRLGEWIKSKVVFWDKGTITYALVIFFQAVSTMDLNTPEWVEYVFSMFFGLQPISSICHDCLQMCKGGDCFYLVLILHVYKQRLRKKEFCILSAYAPGVFYTSCWLEQIAQLHEQSVLWGRRRRRRRRGCESGPQQPICRYEVCQILWWSNSNAFKLVLPQFIATGYSSGLSSTLTTWE